MGLVALALLAGCAGTEPVVAPPPPAPSTAPSAAPEPDPQPTPDPEPKPELEVEFEPVPDGEPVRVRIPAIDVDAELVAVGLLPDGAMEVPDFGLAGWYTEGPRPGHPGPAAIAAHVDSRAGPDVFHRLRELATGDEVHVDYDSGDQVTFVVTDAERVDKDELPVDRIWPRTSERSLTLITCGGEFDRSVRSYRDNVIVYTRPAEA